LEETSGKSPVSPANSPARRSPLQRVSPRSGHRKPGRDRNARPEYLVYVPIGLFPAKTFARITLILDAILALAEFIVSAMLICT
jgi:hypothetical protein